MKMIMAIIRTTSLEHIVRKLEHIGIRNLTISEIKGIGEEVPLFKPYTIRDRIEIIVSDDKADEAARTILEHAATGLPGDGVIAVSPLDYAIKIRTKEKLT
jgi:nitrogen regulatory protein P-II 1